MKKLTSAILALALLCSLASCGGDKPVTEDTKPAVVDNGGFWWGALGCCVPIVGLILFLVWKDTKPKTAKAAGKGALISVIISVVYYLLMIIIGVIAGTM